MSAVTLRSLIVHRLGKRRTSVSHSGEACSIVVSAVITGCPWRRYAVFGLAARRWQAHHGCEQMAEGHGRVSAEAAMDGRDLDDGAARGHQPVKAFRLAQLPDGAGRLAAANQRDDGEGAL